MGQSDQPLGLALQRGVRRWVHARLFARWIVDLGAIWAGAAAAYALSSGSVLAAIGGAAAAGLYGLWCFYDGSA
jgi:hypothetical protein